MSDIMISPGQLGEAITEQLALLCEDVQDKVNEVGLRSIKKLVNLTKASAPVRSGNYYKSLTHTVTDTPSGDKTYTWGAKSPHHRLTHLLVNGHPTPDGGRVPGDQFLEDALEVVLPEYERGVEEVLSNDS